MKTQTREFRKGYWARQACAAQEGACNALAVLNSAVECLREWREAGGAWNGEDCPAFRMLIHQVSYLCGVDPAGVHYGREAVTYHNELDALREQIP